MATSSAVPVVSRTEWGAVGPDPKKTLDKPVKKVVIHHTALKSSGSLKNVMDQLVSIQRYHVKERGFEDIGYNFLVGDDGTVFEGRGWGVVGAHAKGHNDDSVGVAFLGDFNDVKPSKEAIEAVKRLLQEGVCGSYLHPTFSLCGHRDLGQTECPGTNLYSALSQLKSTP